MASEPPGGARPWSALVAGMVALVAACTFQYGLPYGVPTLRSAGVPLTEVAWLVSAPVVGVLCTLIAWGALADRVGERWVLAGSLAGAALLLAAAARVQGRVPLGLLLGLAGASAAAVQVASGRLILGWFAARRRGLAMGLRQTAQPLGVGLAAVTVPHLSPARPVPSTGSPATGLGLPAAGLGRSLLLMAALCLIASVVAACLARDPVRDDPTAAVASSPYREPYLWRLHLASALLVIPQFGVAAFAFDYLVTVRGVGAGAAGGLLALAQGGGAVARLAAGWWSDRAGNRLGPMRVLAASIAAGVLATGVAAAALAPRVPTAVVLAVAAVLVVSTNGLAFTAVAERAGRAWAGRALGVQNTGQNAVAVLTAPVLAAMISGLGNRDGYPLAFLSLVLPAALAVAVIPVAAERQGPVAAERQGAGHPGTERLRAR